MLVPLKNRNRVRVPFPKMSISQIYLIIHIPYSPMLSCLISVVVVAVVVVDYVIVDSVVLGVVGKADDRNRWP